MSKEKNKDALKQFKKEMMVYIHMMTMEIKICSLTQEMFIRWNWHNLGIGHL